MRNTKHDKWKVHMHASIQDVRFHLGTTYHMLAKFESRYFANMCVNKQNVFIPC